MGIYFPHLLHGRLLIPHLIQGSRYSSQSLTDSDSDAPQLDSCFPSVKQLTPHPSFYSSHALMLWTEPASATAPTQQREHRAPRASVGSNEMHLQQTQRNVTEV